LLLVDFGVGGTIASTDAVVWSATSTAPARLVTKQTLIDCGERTRPSRTDVRVEAALGQTASAIARLKQLVISTDDPDYPAHLAILLNATGRTDEARHWSQQAATRYDQHCARHPDAFTDRAARFRLALHGRADSALTGRACDRYWPAVPVMNREPVADPAFRRPLSGFPANDRP
jgi:hypothetical protein